MMQRKAESSARPADRVHHGRGRSAYELGVNLGSQIGSQLEESIQQYFFVRLADISILNQPGFQQAAQVYMNALPARFRDELYGLSTGARVPLARLAEWVYLEPYLESGCTGVVCLLDGHAWVARNNDIFAPHLWGYAAIRELDGRIPTITFGLLGDVFTPTGVNRNRLWLHYNYLDVWDAPTAGKLHLPPYAFIVEALETCSSLEAVEILLAAMDRDSGMLLFAVDGKTDEFALYECTCCSHLKRSPTRAWLAGANHYIGRKDLRQDLGDIAGSISRLKRIEALTQALYDDRDNNSLPGSLIRILADDQIERRDNEIMTAYANVACPSTGQIWYTFGGYPAASQGNWAKLDWPWKELPNTP